MPDSDSRRVNLGKVVRMAKYYPNVTERKGMNHYVDVRKFVEEYDD